MRERGRAAALAAVFALVVVIVVAGVWSATREAPLPAPAALGRSTRIVVTASALWAGHVASRTVTRLALPGGTRAWQTALSCEPATLAGGGSAARPPREGALLGRYRRPSS